jgi:hypothetical protein
VYKGVGEGFVQKGRQVSKRKGCDAKVDGVSGIYKYYSFIVYSVHYVNVSVCVLCYLSGELRN